MKSLEWPGLVWRCRIGQMRVRVYPTGLLALCLMQYLIGLSLIWMLPIWGAVFSSYPLSRTTLNAMEVPWRAAVVYVPLAVLSTIVHELGHVAGAHLAGTPVKSYVLGSSGRVYSETPVTDQGLILLKVGGPLVGLAYGLLLLVTAPSVGTPIAAAGVWSVLTAAINLLPVPPANSDGQVIWRSVRSLRAVRNRIP